MFHLDILCFDHYCLEGRGLSCKALRRLNRSCISSLYLKALSFGVRIIDVLCCSLILLLRPCLFLGTSDSDAAELVPVTGFCRLYIRRSGTMIPPSLSDCRWRPLGEN
ncbi:hypothetical protein NPIL_624141 [Nephila pilipes]|uniref:Uncharacterized protein n=1 Tax=Nephila pilipes TaxID=299642 RepID=A0A8X6TFB8_NEPPI|nr:hypothetical protein NPIL_624141 [Nephila pilipes]